MIALAFLMPLSFGVKGGALLSDTTTANTQAEYRWYTLGPSVEFRLPRNFAVEFNPALQAHRFTPTAPRTSLAAPPRSVSVTTPGSFPSWPSTTVGPSSPQAATQAAGSQSPTPSPLGYDRASTARSPASSTVPSPTPPTGPTTASPLEAAPAFPSSAVSNSAPSTATPAGSPSTSSSTKATSPAPTRTSTKSSSA